MMEEQTNPSDEWRKFGILVAIMLGTVLVVALIRPFIFGRVVPAIMGEGLTTAPLTIDTTVPKPEPTASPTTEEDTETAMPETAENESPNTPANPEEFPTAAPAIIHTIQPGETLYAIARRYNTTIEAIKQANNIQNTNDIKAGDQLIIPQP